MVPTIVISLFSVLFVIFAINEYFSDQIGGFVKSSDIVAKTYAKEQQNIIANSTAGLAADLRKRIGADEFNRSAMEPVLTRWTQGGPIDEAVIIDANNSVLASAEMSVAVQFELTLPDRCDHPGKCGTGARLPDRGQ